MTTIEQLAQCSIDVLAYFLPAFSIVLVVSWVCHLFHYK